MLSRETDCKVAKKPLDALKNRHSRLYRLCPEPNDRIGIALKNYLTVIISAVVQSITYCGKSGLTIDVWL